MYYIFYIFKILKRGKLYLNNVTTPKKFKHLLEEWHGIMGNCNVNDILKLEENVQGMQITDRNKLNCEVCSQTGMYQSRNGQPNKRATKILELVPIDFAELIDPEAERTNFNCSSNHH